MDTSTSIFVLASFFIFPLGMPDPLNVMNPSMAMGPSMSPAMNNMMSKRAADYGKYTSLLLIPIALRDLLDVFFIFLNLLQPP